MSQADRDKMENALGQPPYVRRWAKDVNEAIEEGTGWSTTTTTTVTTTTSTVTTTTVP
jgi:hypothetical protein